MANIPSKIHYCWFGKTDMPDKEKAFIAGWKQFFPEHEVLIWNEDNFDISKCSFAKEAYDKGLYAFVSDYVRAKVLYQYGGIYMDTDVEVISSFPDLKNYKSIVGFERRKFIGTAILASEPHNEILKKLLDYYETHEFILKNGNMDIVANVSVLTDIMIESGLVLGGKEQDIKDVHIFPREVFYPKKLDDNKFRVTGVTCAIHHCNNSWMSDKEKKRGKSKIWIKIIRPILQKNRKVLLRIIGAERTRAIELKIRNKLK